MYTDFNPIIPNLAGNGTLGMTDMGARPPR